MGRERSLQSRILKHLRSLGHYAVVICPPVEAGTPDILASIDGFFVGLEIKVQGKPSKIQQFRMNQISQSGGVATVLTSMEDLSALLSALKYKKHSEGNGIRTGQ